jgi:two-component system sensor histidine kinase BarA
MMTKTKDIDWELSLKLANNKAELAKEILQMYVDELPETRKVINQHYKDNNMEKLHMQVHRLHGASCYCGVPKIKDCVSELESAIKKKRKTKIKELVERLETDIDAVLKSYKKSLFV